MAVQTIKTFVSSVKCKMAAHHAGQLSSCHLEPKCGIWTTASETLHRRGAKHAHSALAVNPPSARTSWLPTWHARWSIWFIDHVHPANIWKGEASLKERVIGRTLRPPAESAGNKVKLPVSSCSLSSHLKWRRWLVESYFDKLKTKPESKRFYKVG